MSEQAIIEVLDDVGGWVQPDELVYQLERLGRSLNPLVLADLLRAGRVRIEPAGYVLSDEEIWNLHPGPLPAIVYHRPRRRRLTPTREPILRAMQLAPEREWTSEDLVQRVGRSPSAVQQALSSLFAIGCLQRRPQRGHRQGRGQPRYLYSLVRDREAVCA